MVRRVNLSLDKRMNEAIEYLCLALKTTGHNAKPVLLHSIRVGLYLDQLGYSEDIILAGLLHDILEDTDTLSSDLQHKFGLKVSELVSATSFNSAIQNQIEKFQELFKRCEEYGKEALIVKAADILDNSHYIQFAKNNESKQFLLMKMKCFLEQCEEKIGDEKLFCELNERYEMLLEC